MALTQLVTDMTDFERYLSGFQEISQRKPQKTPIESVLGSLMIHN